ncbi:MAG: aminotransferase class I/II-fold pyridoxal phosphate-dependent enzyme [Corynebacterium sp.]|uniref:MalY/PatB family protein n=1 Tax=Corynebacterium sp. TaxID=1720 RepID=UPI0026DD730D|nr:aminotransferase class I/II-fold pyridoxal phosphate-dependent enzyme [Corynebacterium sp.]MDO5029786.1 aminotransferase class I/II-fold pyridoxal phosphate-dependent enzyme [Corynebacterium sp.]
MTVTNDAVTFPALEQLRARGTVKWTAFDQDVLPLWVAESDATTCPAVRTAIAEACEKEQFGYLSQDISALTTATADFSAARYGWRPKPENIFAIADVVRGVSLAVEHFTRPGSAIVVPTPAYMPFFQLGPALGRDTVCIPTLDDGPEMSALERAFADGAGCLILCNPNNPLGFTYSADTLREITDLASRYGVRVISDEIHGPVVLDGTHTPTASVSETAAAVTITVTATSKGWNTAGLKCAQILFNDEDAATWQGLPFIVREGASILGVAAATAAYRDGVAWLDNFIEVLRNNRDTLSTRLAEIAPQARFTPPAASFLAWLDLTDVPGIDAEDPAAWLVKNAKIALNPGFAFGEGGAGHVRLNFATSPEILNEALDRFAAALPASN